MDILTPALSLGALGLTLGALLGWAAKIFRVEQDERISQIVEVLPGANCGGCGFAGCSAFASAVVSGDAPVSGCPVGSQAASDLIASIMGVSAVKKEEICAFVRCNGKHENVDTRYDYYGFKGCAEANRVMGGPLACQHGCMGFGDCVKACAFGAITLVDGVAVVDAQKCSGCGACVSVCPKSIIVTLPKSAQVKVNCCSADKGAMVNKTCRVGCIACRLCEKACSYDAIHVTDNLAVIDYSKCVKCGACVEKCPKKTIKL